MAEETGGFNSLAPVFVSAVRGLPVIDGDGCGRAVPEFQDMYQFHGLPVSPFVLADWKGNCAVLYVDGGAVAETLGRAVTTEFGMVAGCVAFPMQGRDLKRVVIPGTVSLAGRIGACLRLARARGQDPIGAVAQTTGGFELIRGTVTKISGGATRSFDYGSFEVEGFGACGGKRIWVDFKNENMIAWQSPSRVIAMVPDIITVIGLDGDPLTNSDLRPGVDVAVLAIRAHDRWREGPQGFDSFRHILRQFGYEGPYVPVEQALRE